MRPTFSKISNFDKTQSNTTFKQTGNDKKLRCDMNNMPAETKLKKYIVDEKEMAQVVIKHERNI